MRIVKKILKWIGYILAIPLLYLIISLCLTFITVNKNDAPLENTETIYLSTNGVHLDIVLQKKDINPLLLKGLVCKENEHYISFGWGEKNFYINTPTWNDLTFKNAFTALFLKSETLMHLTRYQNKRKSWVKIALSKTELQNLNTYILKSFQRDANGNKIILPKSAYSFNDNFYKAKGSYSCFKTCNTWVNSAIKESDLKACYWTPFDFGLLHKYK